VKLHAIFLRDECTLPERFVPHQEQFCRDWMLVEGFAALTFDSKIRGAGWHFMWRLGSSARRGCGRTREGALHHALKRALKVTEKQFNASELDSIQARKYPGFYVVKVVLQPRLIQLHASVDDTA
jgi:hypothetical protein